MAMLPASLSGGLLLAGAILTLVVIGPAAGVPLTAAPTGDLSGTVTAEGAPLANAWVWVTPVSATGSRVGDAWLTATDGDGRYALPGLPHGHVKVQVRVPASERLVGTYWPAAYTFQQAGTIQVTQDPVVADVDLPVGGTVEGRVVDATTGDPVPDVRVTASTRGRAGRERVGVLLRAGSRGGFAISALPPVPLELAVRLPPGSAYLGPWYDGPGWQRPLRIEGSRRTTGVVVALRRGAELQGTVRDDRGQPVAGARIRVTWPGCPLACPGEVRTDASGAYRLPGIPPGSDHRLLASADGDLLPQWYAGMADRETATRLSLASGEVRRSVDFTLTRGAFLTVRVLGEPSGRPLAGVIAILRPPADPHRRHLGGSTPGDPHRVVVGPVPPGVYRLALNPGATNPGYRRLVASTWTSEVVRLEAGEHAEAVVRLADPAAGDPAGSSERPGACHGNCWPGLRDLADLQGGRDPWR